MDLTLADEQVALRAAARGFLTQAAPADQLALILDEPPHWRPEIWPKLAALGWLGISAPAERGGAGLGLLEEVVVVEEAGAALLPAPLHSAVGLALPILLRATGEDSLLRAFIDGQSVVTFGWAETSGQTALAGAAETSVVAAPVAGAQWRLRGVKRWVPDAGRADVIIVPARTDRGVALFAVELPGAGVVAVDRKIIDPVRPLADLNLTDAPARLIVPASETSGALEAVRLRALVLAAAESVGIARRMLELAVSYSTSRQQFGRVIGHFQAISHRLADVYINLELARSLVLWAALLIDTADAAAPAGAAAAAAKALPVAVSACETAIQVHGGIGITWESPLHRYFKHALAMNALDLSPAEHRAEVLGGVTALLR
jgi:alkylation response protein AidB-like acyl-CoA dehydrogenase